MNFSRHSTIIIEGKPVGEYTISPMPGCSIMGIFHGVKIYPEFRGKGYGKIAHGMRLDVAKELGYKMVQCTTVEGNLAEEKILRTWGWQEFGNFWNTKTLNTVFIWKKYLDPNRNYEELYDQFYPA